MNNEFKQVSAGFDFVRRYNQIVVCIL